jgi:type IV pilus assembly protein PilA
MHGQQVTSSSDVEATFLSEEKENYMLSKLQERRSTLADESAFTLIELLVVLIIIGVLLAIAIPSYLGFQKKAQSTAAASDVRSAIPDAEAYYSDNSNYTNMTTTALKGYDSGMLIYAPTATPPVTSGIVAAKPLSGNAQGYCISAVDGGHWAHVVGPGRQVTTDPDSVSTDPCAGL